MTRVALLAAWLVAIALPAQAAERVEGLLRLPEVLGASACDYSEPIEIALYSAPEDAQSVGSLRKDQRPRPHPAGGCEGTLEVNAHLTGVAQAIPLRTQPLHYDDTAAVVLQHRDGWFRVQLADRSLWLRASERDEYLPLERVLREHSSYVTKDSDGRVTASPGAPAAEAPIARLAAGCSVRVGEVQQEEGALWVQIEALGPASSAGNEPEVTARGWMRAHGASGEPAIWFHPKGC